MVMASPIGIPQIRPISDLRTNLNEVCDVAHESQEPIYLTKNGKAALVVFDCEAYQNMQQQQRYTQKLREAEIESRYRDNRVSQEQLDSTMERIFSYWHEAKTTAIPCAS